MTYAMIQHLNPQRELVNEAYSLKRPAVFSRHIHFVNFAQYLDLATDGNASLPVYFSMVRDPVERFRSYYYYCRRRRDLAKVERIPQFVKKQNISEGYDAWRNMDLEECLLTGASDCRPGAWHDDITRTIVRYKPSCSVSCTVL